MKLDPSGQARAFLIARANFGAGALEVARAPTSRGLLALCIAVDAAIFLLPDRFGSRSATAIPELANILGAWVVLHAAVAAAASSAVGARLRRRTILAHRTDRATVLGLSLGRAFAVGVGSLLIALFHALAARLAVLTAGIPLQWQDVLFNSAPTIAYWLVFATLGETLMLIAASRLRREIALPLVFFVLYFVNHNLGSAQDADAAVSMRAWIQLSLYCIATHIGAVTIIV